MIKYVNNGEHGIQLKKDIWKVCAICFDLMESWDPASTCVFCHALLHRRCSNLICHGCLRAD